MTSIVTKWIVLLLSLHPFWIQKTTPVRNTDDEFSMKFLLPLGSLGKLINVSTNLENAFYPQPRLIIDHNSDCIRHFNPCSSHSTKFYYDEKGERGLFWYLNNQTFILSVFRKFIRHCGYIYWKKFTICRELFDRQFGSCRFDGCLSGYAPRCCLRGMQWCINEW